jgi:hypothetical protein
MNFPFSTEVPFFDDNSGREERTHLMFSTDQFSLKKWNDVFDRNDS